VPASSGAKASLACEERQLVGCARASTRLQKSANDAQVQRSTVHWQTERVDEDQGPKDASQGAERGFKGVDDRQRGG